MARKANSAVAYVFEPIKMIGFASEMSITRADCYAAFIDAGFSTRDADNYAFGWADRTDMIPEPNARAFLAHTLRGNSPASFQVAA